MTMPRVKIDMPDRFSFSCDIPVRIGDINYGGHLGNDAVLGILHEARMRYLLSLGCSELDACGTSLIMTDVAVNYKQEGFYGDVLQVQLAAGEISSRGFALFYQVTCERGEGAILVAEARTGMLCFDYGQRKVSVLPDLLRQKLEG